MPFELSKESEADPVTASQAKCNRSTEKQWQMYARHRRAIERLIVPQCRGQSITVLGAGNCNDLDLEWLTQSYAQVHLVDLDPVALAAGVKRQLRETPAGLRLHSPFDLTGIAPRVAAWEKRPPSVEELIEAARVVGGRSETPWGACDVVLSPCVLTQTINPVREAIRGQHPTNHPAVVALRAAIRARHLRIMAGSLKPGGRGVMAIDLISSEKFPELARVPEDQLQNFMDRFIADGKSYRGLEPASMARAIREAGLHGPRVTPPWLWHLGLRRSFLVYGVTFTNGERPGASPEASALGLI